MTRKTVSQHTDASLSALFDGQADELELRRLLTSMDESPEIVEKWHRYSMISASLKKEPIGQVDLLSGIKRGLDIDAPQYNTTDTRVSSEVTPLQKQPKPTQTKRRWPALASSGAIAASVTLAVLFGARTLIDSDSVTDAAVASSANPSNRAQVAEQVQYSEAQLKEAQEKLKHYVLEHAENSAVGVERSVMPFARAASFERSEQTR